MDNIIYLIIMWTAAILFIIIGVYVMNRKKPVWFWVGDKISESRIKNVKGDNRANGKMWCAFSIPFFVSGIAEYFSPVFSIIIFALTGTVGVVGIVWSYHKIEEKYIIK